METSKKIKVLSWIQATLVIMSILLLVGLIKVPSFSKEDIAVSTVDDASVIADSVICMDCQAETSQEFILAVILIILTGVLATINIVMKTKEKYKLEKVPFYRSGKIGFYALEVLLMVPMIFAIYLLIDEIIRLRL